MNTYRATFACHGDEIVATVEAPSFDAAEVEARHFVRSMVTAIVAPAYRLTAIELLGGAK